MLKKIKFKQVCAGLLSLTLLTMSIIPYINKQETQAYSTDFGICIDNHNFSTSGSYSKTDKYTDKMINMNEIQAQYGYNSAEYKTALAKNVETLHRLIGSDEQIVKMFWAGIVAYVTEGKTFANANDLQGAQYWITYAKENYRDSVIKGYAPEIETGYNFVPMTETELGIVLHGDAGQSIINRDPFLAMLANPDTLFSSTTWDHFPQALPRLSNIWLQSYDAFQEGNSGRGQWPKDLSGHEVAGMIGFTPSKEEVQIAALDMETNENYKVEGKPGVYRIEMTEDFFNNCGTLMVFDESIQGWRSMNNGANGWECRWIAQPGYWAYEFEYTGGNKPTSLIMYFQLPQNAITSANQLGFDSPVEFVARFTHLYTCDTCGGGHASGKLDSSKHQRFLSFYFDENPSECYPCLRLGDPVTNPQNPETELTFNIYRHTEDMESNYNVQLDKYDYETGKSLENSIFELYERFDDKDEVNLERDGAVELYKGGDDTCKQSIVI